MDGNAEMTHDELLAKINIGAKFHGTAWSVDGLELIKQSQALRAVVELHKPVQGSSDIQTYDYVGCDACVEWSHDGNMNLRYPCPTIQAITDNLK